MNLIESGLLSLSGSLRGVVAKATAPQRRSPSPYDSRGVVGRYVPGMPAWWGQPSLSELASGISPARMRDIALKSPTTAAALNAILDYACGVVVHPATPTPRRRRRRAPISSSLTCPPGPTARTPSAASAASRCATW